jgi:phosphoribosylformimino-5-aminoimidazole carboxamide ribotide isomerase
MPGASHVIVTSWVFREGRLDEERLSALIKAIGAERLVLDLSCRLRGGRYWVVTDRWQTFTEMPVDETILRQLAPRCAEFLVHAVDVEGKQAGIDHNLIQLLAAHVEIPVTYAGGANQLADLDTVRYAGQGRVHLTIGSALDIFGGALKYEDCVKYNRRARRELISPHNAPCRHRFACYPPRHANHFVCNCHPPLTIDAGPEEKRPPLRRSRMTPSCRVCC